MKTMTATGHLQLTLYLHSDSACHDSTQKKFNQIKGNEKIYGTLSQKAYTVPRLEGHAHTQAANQSVATRVDLEVEI